MYKSFLYVHIIWATAGKADLLSKPVRVVLFAHLRKVSEEKGIRILHVNGTGDHIHVLVQLHPAQNLTQVVRQLKSESADWTNATQLLSVPFAWDEEFAAYTVSPGSLQQVGDFIMQQEAYHQHKTLDSELAVFLPSVSTDAHT